jgi:hypothetical protein
MHSSTFLFLIPGGLLALLVALKWRNRGGRNWGAVQQILDIQYADLARSSGPHLGRMVLIAVEALMIAALVGTFFSGFGRNHYAAMVNFRFLLFILLIPMLAIGGVIKSLRPTPTQWTYGLCAAGIILFVIWMVTTT